MFSHILTLLNISEFPNSNYVVAFTIQPNTNINCTYRGNKFINTFIYACGEIFKPIMITGCTIKGYIHNYASKTKCKCMFGLD